MPILPPIREYQPEDQYNHIVDNIPINDIKDVTTVINGTVESIRYDLVESAGTHATLAQRMMQSLNDDGTLKTSAVDDTTHSIASHTDQDGYVRMTDAERAKLATIASNSTNLSLSVETPSSTVAYDTGIVTLKGSDSITWRIDNQDIYADVDFPLTVRHRHYYDITPDHVTPITPDYINYYANTGHTAYRAGSLRVFINGVRVHADGSKVPIHGVATTWTTIGYSEDTAVGDDVPSGKFVLTSAITISEVISVDFDTSV
jgi:hypothetical protein